MDRSKCIEELEGDYWGEPCFESSLVTECHKLRKVRVCELSTENLRLLIGQKIGLQFVVPLAIEMLEIDSLVSGDLYRGDLLASVAQVPSDFWSQHTDLNNRLVEVKNDLSILADTIVKELSPALDRFYFQ